MARKKQLPTTEAKRLVECVVGDYIEVLVNGQWRTARFCFLVGGTAPHVRYTEYDSLMDEWIEARDLTELPDDSPVRIVRRVNSSKKDDQGYEEMDPILRR